MKQEEKELLLRDLFGRLPYGAFVQFEVDGQKTIKPLTVDFLSSTWYHTEWIKPYLRPMSSMTRKEEAYDRYYTSRIRDGIYGSIDEYVDWLNKKGFDFRHLIPKGLALEAPEDMYKTE